MAKSQKVKTTEDLMFELAKPFPRESIEWRVQRTTKDGTAGNLKYPGSVTWQILSPYVDTDSEKYSSTNPAIFETEPKENVDLNIYYEVGQIYPIELNEKTGEQFDKFMSWKDREQYLKDNPELRAVMTSAALIGGTGDRTKPPAGFNDVLSRVAENSPFSPLAETHGKKDRISVAKRNIVKKARKKLLLGLNQSNSGENRQNIANINVFVLK